MVILKGWAIVIFVLNVHLSFRTWKNKNPVCCHHFVGDVSFVSRVVAAINTQGNLITGGCWNRCHFNFAIYLCRQKQNRKIGRSKICPFFFFFFLICGFPAMADTRFLVLTKTKVDSGTRIVWYQRSFKANVCAVNLMWAWPWRRAFAVTRNFGARQQQFIWSLPG